jgi:hypothetical protein
MWGHMAYGQDLYPSEIQISIILNIWKKNKRDKEWK